MNLSSAASSLPRLESNPSDEHSLLIKARAPFRLDLTAWALRRRSENAVDRWDGHAYRRLLMFGDKPAALAVTQRGPLDAPQLMVKVGTGPNDTDQAVRSQLHRLLGLSVDLSAFTEMAAGDSLLGPLAARMRALKPPRFPTVFEALVNAIACQQLSLAVGIQLLDRLSADRGRPTTEDPEGPRAFPDPGQLAGMRPDELRLHGFSMTKARTIVEAAQAIASRALDLEALEQLEDAAAVERLTRLRGIGRWSAEYVLLRGLGRLHIFPGDDVGAHNKLRRLLDRNAARLRGRTRHGGALASLRRTCLFPSTPGLPGRGWPRDSE